MCVSVLRFVSMFCEEKKKERGVEGEGGGQRRGLGNKKNNSNVATPTYFRVAHEFVLHAPKTHSLGSTDTSAHIYLRVMLKAWKQNAHERHESYSMVQKVLILSQRYIPLRLLWLSQILSPQLEAA